MHSRYALCRADKLGASKIGTFACRTFHAIAKQAKEPSYPKTIQLNLTIGIDKIKPLIATKNYGKTKLY